MNSSFENQSSYQASSQNLSTPAPALAGAPKNWVRADDGVIGGVCLAMARHFNFDVIWVRVIWLLSFLFFGTGLLVYALCVVALPRTDKLNSAMENKILGVCVRLAQRGNVEVGLMRLAALFLLCTSFGAAVLGYLVLHFVLPQEEPGAKSKSLI